ncbi:MAG: hypothetical protein ABI600_06790 [Luteolibacter sp.]
MNSKLPNHSIQRIKIHVTAILESLHECRISDLRISPRNTASGKCVLVRFRTSDDPTKKRSRLFGVYHREVWLEGPADRNHDLPTNDAA